MLKTIEFLVRLVCCVGAAFLYEYQWFTKDHILGYLWMLNNFRAKGHEIDGIYHRMFTEDYPDSRALWVNICVALLVIYITKKIGLLKGQKISGILSSCFWLSILFIALHLPIMFTTRLHWQPYFHNHIHGFRLLFIMAAIWNVQLGERFSKVSK